MEDGIERMMTSESYNVHFLNKNENENKIKKIVEKELIVKNLLTTTKNENELNLNDIKELKSTNPQ